MSKYIQWPDGSWVEVPDDATPEQLSDLNVAYQQAVQAQALAETPTWESSGPGPEGSGTPEDLARSYREQEAPGAKAFVYGLGEAMGNVPGSAANVVTGIVDALTSPIDTGKAIGNVALGAAAKVIPGYQPVEEYANAVGDYYADRYGGWGELGTTLREDPVGAAMDLSGLAGFVGLASRASSAGLAAAGAGKAAEKAARAATYADKVARTADPASLAARGAGKAAGKIWPKGVPESLYERAVKYPPSKLTPDERAAATGAALEYGVMPTHKGLSKLETLIERKNMELDDAIRTADTIETGGINTHEFILNRAREQTNEQMARSATSAAKRRIAERTIDQAGEELLNMAGGRGRTLTAQDLQDFKTRTYRDINWKADPGTVAQARSDTLKALSRGAKEAIEEAAPGVKDLNRQWAAMADLRSGLEQPVNRIANRNLFGLHNYLGAGIGGAVGGVPGAAIGVGASLMENPLVQARSAILLDRFRRFGKWARLLDPDSPAGAAARQVLWQVSNWDEMAPFEEESAAIRRAVGRAQGRSDAEMDMGRHINSARTILDEIRGEMQQAVQ